jgi:hypothetical protein
LGAPAGAASAPVPLLAFVSNRALAAMAARGGSAPLVSASAASRAGAGNRALALTLSRAGARKLSRDPAVDVITGADPAAVPTPYAAKTNDLRNAIIANCAGLVPATEGEQKFYAGVDQASIDAGRAWAAGRGTTYTDCIDWALRRVAAGIAKVGGKGKVPSPVFPGSSPAFVAASAGMPAGKRPSPGDIFIMHSGKKDDATTDSGNFAHTGIIESVDPSSTPETWKSYDGGQGTPAKLAHLEVTRSYDPATNVIGGKILYGWIDVDLI